MRLKLLAAAIMGAAAAVTVPACALAATTITETATIAQTPVPFTNDITLAAFNSSLGTLQSVEFVLTNNTTAQVLVDNQTGATKTFTDALASFTFKVTGPGGFVVSDTVTDSAPSGSIAGHTTFTSAGTTVSDTKTATFTSGLSAFESSLPLTFTADAGNGSFSGNAQGNVFFSGQALTGGSFDVIYTYASAVPEPATWAFLMLGVGGIGLAMRNRRKAGLALAAA